MAANGGTMTEMETFLPQDGSKNKEGTPKKYEVGHMEKGYMMNGKSHWDPFKERKVEHPTTDCDTLTHLLKACLGTGILAMPVAFKGAGLSFGIFATVFIAIVCTHCAYILIKCAHKLYHTTRVTSMSFPDVGEIAFANGPSWSRKYAKTARIAIKIGLFAAYFGTCSVYSVIIAYNFQEVVEFYLGYQLNQRLCILMLLPFLILLSWVPNLKYLAPFSMVANGFMLVGLGITVYYLVNSLHNPWDLPQFGELHAMPEFFSITIFAMEAIGVVMPLENHMKTPQHFIGLCGVLNQGMSGVTLVYILIGFLGYLSHGAETKGSITLNLPKDEIAAQAVKILVGLAVFCTYGLQYFVCLEIVWDGFKEKFKKNILVKEYILRTILTTVSVLLAVAVPTIGPFLALIGALCFGFLGLIIPVLIEFVTYWDTGFGPGNWVVWKNIFLLIFGLLALVSGTYTSMENIIAEYMPSHLSNSTAVRELVEDTLNSTLGMV